MTRATPAHSKEKRHTQPIDEAAGKGIFPCTHRDFMTDGGDERGRQRGFGPGERHGTSSTVAENLENIRSGCLVESEHKKW